MTADMEKDLGKFIGEQNPFTEMRLRLTGKPMRRSSPSRV
jgi:hypothetical protein